MYSNHGLIFFFFSGKKKLLYLECERVIKGAQTRLAAERERNKLVDLSIDCSSDEGGNIYETRD